MPRALWWSWGGGLFLIWFRAGEDESEAVDEGLPRRCILQFQNNYFTEMCSGSSYSRLIDSCISQLKAQACVTRVTKKKSIPVTPAPKKPRLTRGASRGIGRRTYRGTSLIRNNTSP